MSFHPQQLQLPELPAWLKQQDHGPSPYGSTPSPIATPPGAIGGEPVPAPGHPPGGVPPYLKPIPINTRNIEEVFRSYLTAAEPRVMRHLYSTWNAQAEAIKDQEIRNAFRDGELTSRRWAELREQYAAFVAERLAPEWRAAQVASSSWLRAAVGKVTGRPALPFEALRQQVDHWIETRGAELVVDITANQRRALQEIVRHYGTLGESVHPSELARIIRPVVGLTPAQAKAVIRFREKLREDGLDPKSVAHQVGNYAMRLRRVRATRIARTEVAYALNYGGFHQVQAEIAAGNLPPATVKKWLTAHDERTCPFCAALDGAEIGMDETFPGATKRVPVTLVPPAHPLCRCTVTYRVVGGLEDMATGRAPIPEPPKDPFDGDRTVSEAFADPRIRSHHGISITRDGPQFESLSLNLRQTDTHTLGRVRLTEQMSATVRAQLEAAGAKWERFPLDERTTGTPAVFDGEVQALTLRRPDGSVLRLIVPRGGAHWSPTAFLGTFQAEVAETVAERAWPAMRELLESAGVRSDASTRADVIALARARMHMLWTAGTARRQLGLELHPTTGDPLGPLSDDELDQLTGGLWAKVRADVQLVDAGAGYRALFSQSLAEYAVSKAEARCIVHSVGDAGLRLPMLLKEGDESGLLATVRRYEQGIFARGMSSSTDISTGGADSVFVRLFSEDDGRRMGQVFIDARALGRLDWFAFPSDTYGRTSADLLKRRSYLGSTGRGYADGEAWDRQSAATDNEIMMRETIGVRWWRGCVVGAQRPQILAALREAGISRINGLPIEDFIVERASQLPKTAPAIDDVWQQKKKGIDGLGAGD